MPSQLPAAITERMTPKMVAFVDAYVRFGGKHQTRAAIAAGYSATGAQAIASRLLRRQDVLRLLRHITETVIQADVVASAETLRDLRDDISVAPDVRRKAASELLDRAGMLIAKVSEHHVFVEDDRAAQVKRIVELARALDIDPRKLLGAASDVTEADYKLIDGGERGEPGVIEVTPDEEDEPDDARAGLDDVL